jgi:hypothetical protein
MEELMHPLTDRQVRQRSDAKTLTKELLKEHGFIVNKGELYGDPFRDQAAMDRFFRLRERFLQGIEPETEDLKLIARLSLHDHNVMPPGYANYAVGVGKTVPGGLRYPPSVTHPRPGDNGRAVPTPRAPSRRSALRPDAVLEPTGSGRAPAGFCSALLLLFDGVRPLAEVQRLAEQTLSYPASKAADKLGYARNRAGKLMRVGALRERGPS